MMSMLLLLCVLEKGRWIVLNLIGRLIMFLEDIVLRGYIRLLPLLLLISCGTKQVEYPDNVFFYSQFPQEKELKGEIIELDSIFFRYPFRVRV